MPCLAMGQPSDTEPLHALKGAPKIVRRSWAGGMRNPRQRRQLHGREMKMWAIWRGPSGPTVQLSLRFRTGFPGRTVQLSLRLWSLADAVTATIPEIKAL